MRAAPDLALLLLGFCIGLPAPQVLSGVGAWLSRPSSLSLQQLLPSLGASGAASSPAAAAARSPAAPRRAYRLQAEAHHFCNFTQALPLAPATLPAWDVIATGVPHAWPEPVCHWTRMWHPGVPMKPLHVCTHDPAEDGVISTFLHTYHFWGAPDDYNLLLAMGPCTRERPYMLDIGANLGVYTILGTSRGCRALAFEPLSQNILRLHHSLQKGGLDKNALLFKHAVGKNFVPVKIGFRPFNPGASALGVDGSVTERMEQITIDGLLLGDKPPHFEAEAAAAGSAAAAPLPPIIGRHINFIKIDTEGYDVAVVDGMMRTIIDGRPPHILIEFGPNDAAGTAGCNPFRFVEFMYAAGYRMYEGAKAAPLRDLLDTELPFALSGKGRRVFEAWFLHDDAAALLMGNGLLQQHAAEHVAAKVAAL